MPATPDEIKAHIEKLASWQKKFFFVLRAAFSGTEQNVVEDLEGKSLTWSLSEKGKICIGECISSGAASATASASPSSASGSTISPHGAEDARVKVTFKNGARLPQHLFDPFNSELPVKGERTIDFDEVDVLNEGTLVLKGDDLIRLVSAAVFDLQLHPTRSP